ncbi:hypothetical protein Pth03_00830 [Planotetraspora thailandica]|uniref:Uncharacterized protein n=1 Tax=Planotetraspora thailandica TaxID=487172 RepID=A0A8J3XSZ2_9ACTN|nr:hypothetical protein [Planotetraspora thailandica]GII51694.1 hypothetical protein Pth03_00830 [Planotetraspora thailandica]
MELRSIVATPMANTQISVRLRQAAMAAAAAPSAPMDVPYGPSPACAEKKLGCSNRVQAALLVRDAR